MGLSQDGPNTLKGLLGKSGGGMHSYFTITFGNNIVPSIDIKAITDTSTNVIHAAKYLSSGNVYYVGEARSITFNNNNYNYNKPMGILFSSSYAEMSCLSSTTDTNS